MLSFILFSLVALSDSFLDTLVFRSGKSIFPTKWSPFTTYNTIPLTFGLVRLDPFHIVKYILVFSAVGVAISCKINGFTYGYWDIAIYLLLWGVFFEGSWRLFYKP
jgi:hypothetical protein